MSFFKPTLFKALVTLLIFTFTLYWLATMDGLIESLLSPNPSDPVRLKHCPVPVQAETNPGGHLCRLGRPGLNDLVLGVALQAIVLILASFLLSCILTWVLRRRWAKR